MTGYLLIYFGVAIRTYKVTTYFVNNHECLYLLANVGADTNASGSRHERVWEQRRTHLGVDTDASGTVFAKRHRI